MCLLALIVSLVLAGCSAAGPTEAPTAPPAPESQPTEAPTMEPTPTGEEAAETPPALPPPTAEEAPAYPAPPTRDPGPYPEAAEAEPTAPAEAPTFVPETPAPESPPEGLATITGTLMRQVEGLPPSAVADTSLYLAALLTDESGQVSGLARLNEGTAPHTRTNAAGQFVFTDIEPGHYALILKTPLTLQPIKDATTSREIVMDVAAGDVVELGVIAIPLPY
jgi:hypothetical protein